MIGVYFLIKDKRVVYIGQTKDWPHRLIGHHIKDYDSSRFIECDESVKTHYERRWINIFNPKFNRKPGRAGKLNRPYKPKLHTPNDKRITLPDDKAFHHKLKVLAAGSNSVKAFIERLIIDHVLNTKVK